MLKLKFVFFGLLILSILGASLPEKKDTKDCLILELKKEIKNERKILKTLQFYKDAGTIYKWNIEERNIRNARVYAERWQHLTGIKQSKIDFVDYMQGVIHNETNYRAVCKTLEPDGTYSFGITQLNDDKVGTLEKLKKLLPDSLKKRDIKTDPEANICARFILIELKIKERRKWEFLHENLGWKLYRTLQAVN